MSEKRWIAWLEGGRLEVRRYKVEGLSFPGLTLGALVLAGAERTLGPFKAHDRQKAVEIAREKLAGGENK